MTAALPMESREFGGWLAQHLPEGLTGEDMRRLEKHSAQMRLFLSGLVPLAEKIRPKLPNAATTGPHPAAAGCRDSVLHDWPVVEGYDGPHLPLSG